MTDRFYNALGALLATTAIVTLHLMVWCSSWPHWQGDTWMNAMLFDVMFTSLAAVACFVRPWHS